MGERTLTLRGVSAGYGNRTDAIQEIDLELDAGQVHGLIGANGAGKSTLLKVLGGLLPHREGTIEFAGQTLRPSEPAASRLRRGLCLLPEGHRVIPTLTVRENLSLATIGRWPRGHRAQLGRNIDVVHQLFPILSDRSGQLAGHLSGGEQQMLSLGRAIVSEPRVLLLDEPSLGLAPSIVDRIYEAIDQITERGIGLVIVEQNHARLQRACERIDVLRLGRIVHSAAADQLDERAVERAYFGERSRTTEPNSDPGSGTSEPSDRAVQTSSPNTSEGGTS